MQSTDAVEVTSVSRSKLDREELGIPPAFSGADFDDAFHRVLLPGMSRTDSGPRPGVYPHARI